MNEVLADVSDPTLFKTDERFTPRATIPRSPSAPSSQQGKHAPLPPPVPPSAQQENLQKVTEEQEKPQQRQIQIRASNRHQFGSLIVRFVRARLQHMKLHILQKCVGVYVPDDEVAAADELVFGVEEETSQLGEMIPDDIGAIDDAFQFILSDLSNRLRDDKSRSGTFAAGTWYGALCQQVDDHSKLLVDFRNLQNENNKLERERDELKSIVMKHSCDQEFLVRKKLEEKQISRARNELQEGKPSGRTAKLTLEFAMRDAEKRAGGSDGGNRNNNNNNNNNNLVGSADDPSQVEVAKSLRIQDEVTVLRKSSRTLQLALSRVQHRYSVLLHEHENLKSEIRNVIAQQDAEESEIRRIFLEREREFDVASRRIQRLEIELNSKSRKLELAKSSTRSFKNQQQLSHMTTTTGDDESTNKTTVMMMAASSAAAAAAAINHNNNFSGSLAQRMQRLRNETVGKMQIAFSDQQENLLNRTPSSLADDHHQMDKVTNNDNQENAKRILQESHDSDDGDFDEGDATFGENTESSDDDGVFIDRMPTSDNETSANLIQQAAEANINKLQQVSPQSPRKKSTTPTRGRRRHGTPTFQKNQNQIQEASTMTDPFPRKKQSETIGTQTFFRNSATSSLMMLTTGRNAKTGGESSSSAPSLVENSLRQALDAQIARNQLQDKRMMDMEVKLDKIVRTMNKQCHVVEKFLDEQLNSFSSGAKTINSTTLHANNNNNNNNSNKHVNVIFLKQDLIKMLNRFGVPIPSSSSPTSSSWLHTLLRAPVFSSSSPLFDPTNQDEEKLEQILNQIDSATLEAKRLEKFSEQACQTAGDDENRCAYCRCSNSPFAVIDAEEHDPLLAHLKNIDINNNNNDKQEQQQQQQKNNCFRHALPSPKDGAAVAAAAAPSSFWNATEAVNALKRVYVDAGRLMDSVENESEELMANVVSAHATTIAADDEANPRRRLRHDHELNHDDDQDHDDPITESSTTPQPTNRTTARFSSGAAANERKRERNLQQQQQQQLQNQQQQQMNFEKIATEQFFAIRSLESSCKLLVQRLSCAKEDYVRRFYDRSSLLNQTLGSVSRTHPREANKLSRLAKTVQQARSVVPWITGVVGTPSNNTNNNNRTAFEEGFGTASGSTSTLTPPLYFKASEIVLGKSSTSSTSTATPSRQVMMNRPSSAVTPSTSSPSTSSQLRRM